MNAPLPFSWPVTAEGYPANGAVELCDNAREWWRWHFAGRVIPALLVQGAASRVPEDQRVNTVATAAVVMADALIAALEAKP